MANLNTFTFTEESDYAFSGDYPGVDLSSWYGGEQIDPMGWLLVDQGCNPWGYPGALLRL